MIALDWLAKFFATPLGRWIVIGVLVAAALFAGAVYERDVQYREDQAAFAKQREAEVNAYIKMLADVTTGFAQLAKKYGELALADEAKLKAAAAKRLHDLAEQKRRLESDLTPAAVAVCPVLPYGYLVHRYNAAQAARGDDSRVAAPATDALAASAGLSITDTAKLDDEQADAYKACRDRVAGWEQYAKRLKQWRTDANLAIESALKGTAQ